MSDKPKCSKCNERDVFSKGLCSGCYGRNWRAQRDLDQSVAPKQLTSGVIEGEIMPAETHLTATSPAEMQAAQGDMKAWLNEKLTILERDIREANAALNEARRNGWATSALASARNRAVDDETFYNKILAAIEEGHTIIPDFPISIFAVRRHEPDKPDRNTFHGVTHSRQTYLARPAETDCAPAGAGEYRNPLPETTTNVRENHASGAEERGESRYFTTVRRSGNPVGPITFPSMTARSPIMRATANAMDRKVFDQIGVCHPVRPAPAARQVQSNTARAGDPLVIGQVVHKRVGSKQKVASFIIAWHLNLNEL